MRRLLMSVMAAVGVLGTVVRGQELVFDFVQDTTVYDFYYTSNDLVFPHPEVLPATMLVNTNYFALRKKNLDTFDIFSMSGKIGSFTLPSGVTVYSHNIFSQTFIDNDDGWEMVATTSGGFIVIDDDGSILLTVSDTGFMAPRPYLGFDGNNTYVCLRNTDYALTFKAWRFRTDITSAAPPALAKSTSSHGPLPMMTFGPAGDYRVSLQPAGGGKTSLQMFDLLGRCIFTKTIDDLTRPVSFTVPAGNVPRTPFVARVRDENGASMQREIPVR